MTKKEIKEKKHVVFLTNLINTYMSTLQDLENFSNEVESRIFFNSLVTVIYSVVPERSWTTLLDDILANLHGLKKACRDTELDA